MGEWSRMTGLSVLPANEVHVWLASVHQPSAALAEFQASFTPAEKQRLERFRNEVARGQFLVGRGLLRRLLGSYLGTKPSCIRLEYNLRGKPTLSSVHQDHIEFNLSHSQEYVVLAFGRGRSIGIDLENVTQIEEMDAIASRFFTPEEILLIESNPARKPALFFECWTRKEAVLKCMGTGLEEGGDAVAATFSGTVFRLAAIPGYIGALAVNDSSCVVRSFAWSPGVLVEEGVLFT